MQVLRYLGRYTHRIAISNHRLLAFDGEHVTFRWKDYVHGGKQRKMTLLATEFLRRFFLHVLPNGFVGFGTSVSSPTDSVPVSWPYADSCWRWVTPDRSAHTPSKTLRLGTARIVGRPWSRCRDSLARNSRAAVTSIRHNHAASRGPRPCPPHANSHLCLLARDRLTYRVNRMLPA